MLSGVVAAQMRLAALVFPLATAELVQAHVPRDAFVVAVDAGAEALRAADRRPDVLVGDLDSVSEATLAWAREQRVEIEPHESMKDETDGELALARVLTSERVLFIGAGGGRPDHALGNLHLLAEAAMHGDASAVDTSARYWVVTPERPLTLDLDAGGALSVLSFDARATGVTYTGLRYPLREATLLRARTRGISNITEAPPQTISVKEGVLIVIAPTRASR